MAEPLVQRVIIDAAAAQRQLADLERELRQLNQPINVPVDIDVDGTGRAEAQMRDLRDEVDKTGDEFTQLDRKASQSADGISRVGTAGANAFNSLRGSVIAVGVAIAAVQGARLLGNFAFDAIQSASTLQESLSKTNVVFDELSGGIQDFAANAPRALGLSTAAALEATSTFGNLFLALGLSRDAAAQLSPDIVQLASDLASFNNIGVDEAVEKLRSGLVGEVEPLRTLGVNLNAATVEAKALSLGFTDASGAVTEAGKVQARYALILEQTTTAQGDYARTADGIANTQRTLNAEWEDAKTALGEALLPAYKQLLDVLPDLISQVKDLGPSFAALGVSLASAAEGGGSFLSFLLDVGRALPGVASAFGNIFTGDVLQAIDDLSVARLQTGFIDDLREGVDPAKALANALVELNQQTQSRPEDFKKFADQFIAIANLDPGRLADLSRLLLKSGVDAGFSTPQIQELREQLSTLIFEAEGFSRRTPGGGGITGALGIDEDTAPVLTETAAAILKVAQAGGELEGFSLDLGAEGIRTEAEILAGSLDAAREGLKTDEGEIITDLGTFFDQFNAKLAAQEEFQRNLAILRARSQDLLAGVFEGLGVEQGAQLLADAVTDPGSAAAEEARLEAHGIAMAEAEFGAFTTQLTGLIAGYEPLPVVIPLTFGGLPTIPVSALTAGGIGIGGQVNENITINQTFVTEPTPTTTTQRAAQEINSIVANTRR